MKPQKKKLWILAVICGLGVSWKVKKVEAARLNIGLASGVETETVLAETREYGAKLIRELTRIRVLTVEADDLKIERIKQTLTRKGLARFIEADTVRRICMVDYTPVDLGTEGYAADLIPNDTYYSNQWGPACISAPDAWDYGVMGDPNVRVAVVDTGVDYTHPDLDANVDVASGYDFVNNDNDAMDDNGHGTHCAGIIAAEINNSLGIAGLQQVTIVPVKCLDASGSGWDSDCAAAIEYAADVGAKVISCSWGGYGYSSTIKSAIDYAVDLGSIVVAAAGNDGLRFKHYPAAYDNVIGVAALQDCTSRVSWSNYGKDNVLISAPGVDILSTWLGGGYAYASGTSMACPHVSGVVATYFSYNLNLAPMTVVRHMLRNADDLGDPGRDIYYGFGRVDMYPLAD